MIGRQHMKIKIGDVIEVEGHGQFNYKREGAITDISIGLDKSDTAGELGVSVKEYDTELDYLGSVGYGKDYWCYFHQIKNVKEVDNAETED